MLDDLAEALLTDGIGILERSGDGTRLGEAVQSALAALEALKRAEAEAPEVTKERREMPWDEIDDLAEALLTDGIGILERSGDGTRLGEAVQSALAALEALKRAEAEAPEVTKERREMPWDENPEGTMVETGEA